MNDWWNAPVLQGDDNEYGDYDYLIEKLPHDDAKWELSRYTSRCDSCGKERHLTFKSAHYFYTLDGYDYMSYTDCWMCRMENKIWSIKHKIKRFFSVLKMTYQYWCCVRRKRKSSFIECYKLIKTIHK